MEISRLDLRRLSSGPSGAFKEAMRAVERGWSVVPWRVIPDGQKHKKEPDFALLRKATGKPSWAPYKDVRPSGNDLAAWKDADYFAVIPGELSRVLVLDVDDASALEGLDLPTTPTAKTSREGGRHYYYRYPPGLPYRPCTGIVPGADLPAVAVLPNGRERVWEIKPDIPLAHAPAWLVSKLKAHGKPGKPPELELSPSPARDLVTKTLDADSDFAALLPLQRERLSAWFENEAACLRMVAELMQLAGVKGKAPTRLGQSFHCVLPGKPDRKPSATLVQNRKGRIVYKSHRRGAGDSVFTLPDVFYSLMVGRPERVMREELDWLTKSLVVKGRVSTTYWALRLIWQTLDVGLPHVDYCALPKQLPPDAPSCTAVVYDGFLLLARLYELWAPNTPLVYTRRFVSTWCQVGERQAGEAITWLYQQKYISKIGVSGRYSQLRPGPGPSGERVKAENNFVAVGDVIRNVELQMRKRMKGSNP